MSGRDWKPGDVAMVRWTDSGSETVAIIAEARADSDVVAVWTYTGDVSDTLAFNKRDLRPLVVIDPEDREQVDRFAHEVWKTSDVRTRHERFLERFRAVVEGMTPKVAAPKPDEPTGLGAMVEDANGKFWVRSERWPDQPWDPTRDRDGGFTWEHIHAVRVLSEGIQP